MKKLLWGVVGLAILVGLFFLLNSYIYNEKQGDQPLATTPKDATYIIERQAVTLRNGIAETPAAPDSATTITTRYFGNEAYRDLNDDGREDVVFLLTQNPGGTGTFFYVVAALNTENGYVGSHALFLGDRIAPQTTHFDTGKIVVVNYADRAPGESFSVRPSMGKSIWLLLDPATMQFGEVVQNFEGEADPSRMKLDMQTWKWIRAQYNDGREILPKQPGKFTLTFETIKGRFSATTDCNQMSGAYTVTGNQLSFGPIAQTKMYCEGSQETEFASLLDNTASYLFTSRGELILELKYDSGTVTFR